MSLCLRQGRSANGRLILVGARQIFACTVPSLKHDAMMCQSCCLSSAMRGDSLMSLCSLDHLLLVIRTVPTLSLRIFLSMPGPLPRRSLWCSYPFLPTKHRPSPIFERVGTPLFSVRRFLHGRHFEAAVILLCSGLKYLLATQIAPTDTALLYGSRGVYI